ncbi:transcriptional antiterminator [Streptomyces antimicrobicus]|uniref:Transcriptional antiterminator n=1 Tax=Streptomyces antimicrobicus TaxID=2883108 RepID=A0ABS8BCK4_9ACTN|nr:transcriptional antiterminator [Streptomyces antimicrobicus]MCB5182375.1 transcriptional antiterminator [Streptomyces antimicrobicus]
MRGFDDQLALRIRLFRDSGQVRPDVADFVTAELSALAAEGRTVTDETAGMFTSHLLMALTRMLDGVPADRCPDAPRTGPPAGELREHPEAVDRAHAIAARAAAVLGTPPLPPDEIDFLGLHLAVLARTATDR